MAGLFITGGQSCHSAPLGLLFCSRTLHVDAECTINARHSKREPARVANSNLRLPDS